MKPDHCKPTCIVMTVSVTMSVMAEMKTRLHMMIIVVLLTILTCDLK